MSMVGVSSQTTPYRYPPGLYTSAQKNRDRKKRRAYEKGKESARAEVPSFAQNIQDKADARVAELMERCRNLEKMLNEGRPKTGWHDLDHDSISHICQYLPLEMANHMLDQTGELWEYKPVAMKVATLSASIYHAIHRVSVGRAPSCRIEDSLETRQLSSHEDEDPYDMVNKEASDLARIYDIPGLITAKNCDTLYIVTEQMRFVRHLGDFIYCYNVEHDDAPTTEDVCHAIAQFPRYEEFRVAWKNIVRPELKLFNWILDATACLVEYIIIDEGAWEMSDLSGVHHYDASGQNTS